MMAYNSYRNTWFNSSLLFVIASTLQVTLHEAGHFFIARLYSTPDLLLHHNYVKYNSDALLVSQRIAIAAAGPLISLFLGVLFYFFVRHYRKPNLLRLFLLYMSTFGYIGFLGYLMMAPIFTYGDTGYICEALHFSKFLTISIAITGGVLLFFAMKNICREFIPFLSRSTYEVDNSRKKTFNYLIQYPLYTGIVITTLLNLPVPTFLSLIAPICSPFSIMWGFTPLMAKRYVYPEGEDASPDIDKISLTLIYLLTFTILLNRILVNGINF